MEVQENHKQIQKSIRCKNQGVDLMGSTKGFLDLLKGVIQILIVYAFLSPVLDILITINMQMGGKNAEIATMIDAIIYVVVPILLIISYVLYAFITATKEEDTSGYSRW